MASVLKPGSSHIKFDAFPTAFRPTVVGGQALFQCSKIEATGSVTLIGSQPAAGWALGFIQVEWVDTNWLYYRGKENDHGSIFFQRSRPPPPPHQRLPGVKGPREEYFQIWGRCAPTHRGGPLSKQIASQRLHEP